MSRTPFIHKDASRLRDIRNLRSSLRRAQRGQHVFEVGVEQHELDADGWAVVRTRGSHRQLRHSEKPGTVTVSGHLKDDVHPKTLKSALRQAGLENEA